MGPKNANILEKNLYIFLIFIEQDIYIITNRKSKCNEAAQ